MRVRIPLWLAWTAATILVECCAAFVALMTLAVTPLRVALVAAIEGLALGAVQFAILRRPLPTISTAWVGATFGGILVARLCEYFADTSYSAIIAPATLAGTIALGVVLGAAIGAAVAVPQWLILRAHVARAMRWVGAGALAWACALPMMLLGLQGVASLLGPWSLTTLFADVALGMLVVGLIQGLALRGLLKTAHRSSPLPAADHVRAQRLPFGAP